MKNKKALSIVVGYVLLIVFASIVGVIVYKWQQTYVPKDEYAGCTEGVSLFIVNKSYDCDTNILKFAIKNTGQFSIGGYFIYLKDDSEKTLATVDISNNNTDVSSRLVIYNINGVKLGRETLIPATNNSFEPGEVEIEEFDLSHLNDNVYGIEIVPIRWQEEGRKEVLASCKENRISEELSGCSAGLCEDDGQACVGRECGTVMNNCYEYVECGPQCPTGEFCDSSGHCITSLGCEPTSCGALGYNCGIWDNNCGGTLTCGGYGGGCQDGYFCDDGICTVGDMPESCDGNWEGAAEDIGVVCDGGTLCQGNCICEPGAVPNYMGGCMYIGGSQSCIEYCLDQNRLLGTEYTSSTCISNSGQCQSSHGDALSGGNYQCVGAPMPVCCCFPGIAYQ